MKKNFELQNEKRRFLQLLESKMGDVRPLISEGFDMEKIKELFVLDKPFVSHTPIEVKNPGDFGVSSLTIRADSEDISMEIPLDTKLRINESDTEILLWCSLSKLKNLNKEFIKMCISRIRSGDIKLPDVYNKPISGYEVQLDLSFVIMDSSPWVMSNPDVIILTPKPEEGNATYDVDINYSFINLDMEDLKPTGACYYGGDTIPNTKTIKCTVENGFLKIN